MKLIKHRERKINRRPEMWAFLGVQTLVWLGLAQTKVWTPLLTLITDN